ncbi:MAG: transcription-repair coupling factor [Bacteroidaceae bacterium]|nr:transcription-repair coupling factor [Bacteroidaceae bacterium]
MEITELQSLFLRHPQVKALASALGKSSAKKIFLEGVCASATPLFFASVRQSCSNPIVFILNDAEEAGYFYHDLTQVLGEEQVLFFPSSFRRAIKYGQRDAANEILRTEVLNRFARKDNLPYVVTFPEAVAEQVVNMQTLDDRTLVVRQGQEYDIIELTKTLHEYGFQRHDYVYEPGQYALRGSILDVFSFSSELPYRIDFFGDEVDSIRTFEVQSQLSVEKRDSISILPELSSMQGSRDSFFSFLPEETVLAMRDFTYVYECIQSVYDAGFSNKANLEDGENKEELVRERMLIDAPRFAKDTIGLRRLEFGKLSTGSTEAVLRFNISPQPLYHKNFDLVCSSFSDFLDNGYKIYILADSAKQNDRLKAIFEEKNEENGRQIFDGEEQGIVFTPVNKTVHEGFVDNDLKVCIFTDHQIFDRFHKYNLRSDKARSGKVALTLKELSQFEIGDFVVHVDHGVGRFAGLVRIPNGNTTQEAIKIIYHGDDTVYVSIHALHKVSKYKGKEGEPPRVNKLGSGAWERLKDKTKTKIKDIARDLIRLYSLRRKEKGFSFSPDNFMQHELEASFLYEDTPDQLKATIDVKRDMEESRPMDRLVCGDVGFGKTEVAVRAAFKAACDNKQVAVLVPTTVLAFQHYQTFKNRLKDFPVKVDYLSRARSAKQTSTVLKELESGELNIVIGTHKLIGKNVKFKDLGLLIIDEEQKFGVATKEKLRQMRVNVDTLTMTATPIPRTLQFSLMGARDLSVIQTPPPNRYPIQTEIHTFNGEIIAEAINFEMSRNGQVFMVNNRINNLIDLENLIHKYVPDCRVAVGHGQMNPEELEKLLTDFVNYEYDVLLSTTIIESGIDIPNANTIIINSAQNFGLSDLHQMRGRVGRSNRKAFCYLLAPPLSSLTPDARRRLQAIENFSDLGSGIHIAMQDLDIRGAGNMLGAEQSGFIADLGYETYQKILNEAVKELKNDEFADLYAEEMKEGTQVTGDEFVDEVTLESDLEILFPDRYVPSSSERMLLYRELDNLVTDEELEAYRKRLEDRFGPVPKEGEELLNVVPLKRMAKTLGMEKAVLKSGRMMLYFVSNPESAFYQSEMFDKCIQYAMDKNNLRRCELGEVKGKRRLLVKDVSSTVEAVKILKNILK